MNRIILAAVCITGLTTLHAAPNATQQAEPPSIHFEKLSVTGIDPNKWSYNRNGKFTARGNPTMHAVMTDRKMTLDAATLNGNISTAGALKDAVLTGGVSGTLDSDSKQGVNKMSFSGAKATYTDTGSQTDPSADIDLTDGVKFHSVNATVGSKFNLNGTHGIFHLKSLEKGAMSVSSADLDGPITFGFTGVPVGKDKAAEPSSGYGTADHVRLTRGGSDGTDYEVRLSGSVSIKGTGAGFDATFPKIAEVVIILDEAGNFKSLSTGEESISGVIGTKKKHA